MLRRRLALATAAGVAALLAAPVALATTGPTDNLPAPKELVPSKFARIVVGHWTIAEASRASRLRSGQVAIDFAPGPPQPFLLGNIFVTTYDDNGQPDSFLANLYPFKVRNGLVQAKIASQASLSPLGSLVFARDSKPRAQVLHATLTIEGRKGEIVFRRKPHKDVVAGTLPPLAQPLGSGAATATPDENAPGPAGRTGMYAPVIAAALALTSNH
jgi:hypothetical protein